MSAISVIASENAASLVAWAVTGHDAAPDRAHALLALGAGGASGVLVVLGAYVALRVTSRAELLEIVHHLPGAKGAA